VDAVIISFQEALEKQQRARAAALVAEATGNILPELGRVDALIYSGCSLSEHEVRKLVRYLADLVHAGMFGWHARAWAASLLVKLRDTQGWNLSADEKRAVDEAASALAAFDAVAYGTATPEEMRAFVLQKESHT
jgi:hypothetical protein